MSQPPLTSPVTRGAAESARRRAAIAMLVALCCLAIRWPMLTQPGFEQDQVYFLHWASLAERGGVAAVYQERSNGRPWCNYPPVYPYVLKFLAGVFHIGSGQPLDGAVIAELIEGKVTPRTAAASALLKMPAVIADGVTCALLVLWLSKRVSLRAGGWVSFAYAVMPAVIFDSAIWGQVDSIPTLFMLLALESTVRRRWMTSGAFAALAVLTKPQALLFAPLYVAAIVTSDPRHALAALARFSAAALVVSAAVMAPLWSVKSNVLRAYTEAAGYYPFVHLNGFSAWFLANPLKEPRLEALSQFYLRDDLPLFLCVTARTIGFIAMTLVGIAVLVRVMRQSAIENAVRPAARILPLAFMVLCTQMHERYLVPAIAFWAWAYRRTSAWWIGWLTIGAVAFVNLLWVWEQPLSSNALTSIAKWTRSSPGGISTGVLCAIALLAVLLYALTVDDRRDRARPTASTPEP